MANRPIYKKANMRLKFAQRTRLLLVAAFGCLLFPRSVHADVDYTKSIKPLLHERCYSCHAAIKQKAKLRLDTVELMLKGGKSGPVLQRGQPEKSLILTRVTATDLAERMPPEHEGEPFTTAQVQLLRDWIAAGAPAPVDEKPETDPKDHWAYRPRVRPPVPAVANTKWVRNPIDAFLRQQHERHGLTPQPEASRAVQLRRLYLDLIGLPPTTAELAAVEGDTSADWYERVVKRLLDDPRHGERWARHWMDIWRYSDWWGLGDQLRNSQKHIWHWRDWIVESLNADTPYDEMIRLMLAADESHPTDLQKLRATGFLARNWFLFNRHSWMEETVEHVSKGFLGLTVNCAKCHDHKYDPITHTDYYKLRAFFEPYHVRMDVLPGEPDLTRDGIPRAYDGLLDAPTYRFVRGDENRPDKSAAIAPGVPELLAFKELAIKPVALPPEAWQPERRPWILDSQLTAARKKIEATEAAVAKAKETLAAAQKRAAELPATKKPGRDEVQELLDAAASKAAPAAKPANRPQTAATTPPATPAIAPLVTTRFTATEPTRWKLFGGDWSHTPAGLEQKRNGSTRVAARWLEKAPRDFDATVRFTIRGGTTYRSVGLSFDTSQADPAGTAAPTDSELNVYVSAWATAPKIQAAYSRGTVWQYPTDAMRTLPVELNREYTLRVQARGPVINASLNGEPLLAWRSPLARRDGAVQLITYDALAVFHEFTLSPLAETAVLREPSAAPAPAPAVPMVAAKPNTPEAARAAADAAQAEHTAAELAVTVAKAELVSLEHRIAALRATWARMDAGTNSPNPALAETEREKIKTAVLAEREAAVAKARHTIADAELRLARAAKDKKAAVEKELKTARESLDKATKNVSAPVAATEKVTPVSGAKWTPTRFFNSGKDDPTVEFIPTSSGRRSALANWITDPRNPLTARVAANHLWTRHFGTPLVPTVFEFGRKNPPPTHPELLDWLASELVDNGWSMKHLHRLIVTSAAYRMSSSLAGGETSAAKDPDNLRWWRRTPIRLEAQAVRDSLLALSGELDPTIGGPSVPTASQAESKRRSLYFFHSNNERNLFLTTFDEAGVKECYRREQSIVPQQALALANSRLVHDAASLIATRLTTEVPPNDDKAFVRQAFRTVLGTAPGDAESAACLKTLDAWRKLPQATPATARAQLVWALFNHNDFVTLR